MALNALGAVLIVSFLLVRRKEWILSTTVLYGVLTVLLEFNVL